MFPTRPPGLARELLLELGDRDAAVPVIDGLPQPACAVYARSALPVITTALDSGERAVRAVLDRLNIARVVRGDAGTFTNLNTPADYRAFLESLRHHG